MKLLGLRKLGVYVFTFLLSIVLLLLGKWTEQFGYFTLGLVGLLFTSNVVSKFGNNKVCDKDGE